MNLQDLVKHFIAYPSYLETGAPKLAKKFNVSTELINQAKQEVRQILKNKITEDLNPNMSLKEFGELLGIDMDSNPEEDYPKEEGYSVGITWENMGRQEKEELKQILNSPSSKIVLDTEVNWEVKSKWVKTDKESTFLVKKNQETDYKKEFEQFLNQYNPKPQLSFKPKFDKYSSALMVYMSDKHIGAETKEGALFENKWNKDNFMFRMSELAKEIIRLNELYHFDTIVLFDLGDAIDGFDSKTTRGKHILPQNMSNREVFNTFMSVHADFFYTLTQYCNCNLKFITAGESNHGGDVEWILNKSLEAVLNLRFPQIETFIGDKFIEHYDIGEHCFVVCHGKDIEDLKFPLPATLNEKTELYFKKYIDAKGIDSKYIHVIKGDTHISGCQWGQFFRYKNVLSMYGSSKWVQTNFMVNTKGVSMDILTQKGVTEHNLFL